MSLTRAGLMAAFPDAIELQGGCYHCKDEVRAFTQHYYVQLGGAAGGDLLIVTRDHTDDAFVHEMLTALGPVKHGSSLRIVPIPPNDYGFSSMLLVPSTYHNDFRGRLDDERAALTLAIPIHRCEFTGNETPQEFATMTHEVIAIHDWHRQPAPRIALRFDNPLTGAGTDQYVYCTWDLLMHEVRSLNGSNGFIEIQNFAGRILEILSEVPDNYVLIWDRNDTQGLEIHPDYIEHAIEEFVCSTEP